MDKEAPLKESETFVRDDISNEVLTIYEAGRLGVEIRPLEKADQILALISPLLSDVEITHILNALKGHYGKRDDSWCPICDSIIEKLSPKEVGRHND